MKTIRTKLKWLNIKFMTNRTAILLSLLLILVVNQNAFSQVNIVFVQNNSYEVKINDIYNFNIINSSNEKHLVYLEIQITNKNQKVYTATTNTFNINSGLTQVFPNFLKLSKEYKNATGVYSIMAQTGILPESKYELCYKVYDAALIEDIGNNCFDLEVNPLSPPLLLNPNNESIINQINPILIWQGPTPNPSNFKYDIKLVEILGRQSPQDAITRNFGLIQAGNLSETQLLYPFNSPKLENGKTYAWQVVANNNLVKYETEVWTFKLQLDTSLEEKIVFFENYIIPRVEKGNAVINIKKQLRIQVDEEFPIHQIHYEILDVNQKKIIDNLQGYVVSEGSNKFTINLEQANELRNAGYYYLKIQGDKSKTNSSVFFKYYNK
jgi:hypothetical protein